MQFKLILLSLPIGNLGDLTLRAREILETKKTFVVEDTRTFYSLLSHLQIQTEGKRVISFHDQSEEDKLPEIIELLKLSDLVVASEAGSPIISDPAFPLIRAVLEAGGELDTIPAASASVAALELSGLPPHPFHFHAFFPRDREKRNSMIAKIQSQEGTHIFFESPHRILDLGDELSEKLPEYSFAIVKEITKLYQTAYRFIGKDWGATKSEINTRGEFVLLVHSKGGEQMAMSSELKKDAAAYLERPSSKTLSKILGEILGVPPKEIYQKLHQDK